MIHASAFEHVTLSIDNRGEGGHNVSTRLVALSMKPRGCSTIFPIVGEVLFLLEREEEVHVRARYRVFLSRYVRHV